MICNFKLRPRVISQKSEGRYLVWINLFAERLLHFDPLQSHRFRAALLHSRTGGPRRLHLIRRIIMYLRRKWMIHYLWKTKQKQKRVSCQLKGYEPSFLCLEVLRRLRCGWAGGLWRFCVKACWEINSVSYADTHSQNLIKYRLNPKVLEAQPPLARK